MNDDTIGRPAASPILHRKKADLVYEYLREQIINGTYPPGRRMTLADLYGHDRLLAQALREQAEQRRATPLPVPRIAP